MKDETRSRGKEGTTEGVLKGYYWWVRVRVRGWGRGDYRYAERKLR